MHANKSFNRNTANHRLYHALIEPLIDDENAIDKGVADTIKDHKRKHDDDEDPPARPNHSKKTKRRRTKEFESSKEPSSTKETPKVVMDDAGDDVAHDDNQPQDTSEPKTRKSLNPNWFKQPPRPPTPFLNGTSVRPPGHQTVVAGYFFNNVLEYLKTSDLEVTYTSSITKTKAARYEIKGIEYMVPTLWSTIKHAYGKDAEKGIKHWGERHKLVKKLHGYGHLEEIVVKRSDQQLYKFKEGDFVNLHLNDIEDMLLLVVQHKLFHLNGSVTVDFIVALRMLTRSLILKRRVEDLKLGVESDQKKLNITKPQKIFPEIKFKETYTPSYDPPGIVYEDVNKQKRVLRAAELYKFSDGTLKSV
nr:hypothetical protein [Tanacetum cinerariifolium]